MTCTDGESKFETQTVEENSNETGTKRMQVSRFSFALADSLANEEMKEADGWMDGLIFV
ncbi:hypothetical protein DAPPUDRAFT_345260 [Daphnia pulex]|uniref:Uncharacterized protein n=1 Tax=Daphnia pulex TaxID=6669 RepID=E9I7A4_DAPPU|nr:hypothetical protein DAPPUDRAFT_345260 [Daphnia pulex]|eukprot:EFX60126.1 hypothetical protein DAPPUDRAFT_345260 [Daphnia pulex]